MSQHEFKVLLIGNYLADGQESMLRFAKILSKGLESLGIKCEILAPKALIGKMGGRFVWLIKWLRYLDKYLIFPLILRRFINPSSGMPPTVIHICDHSNAPYAAHVGQIPCVITCHDLGAVRGALGEDTYCPASRSGRVLQRWILSSLHRAAYVVCDSTATQGDVRRLLGRKAPKTEVIFLGLNQEFASRSETESVIMKSIPQFDLRRPYLLHVGSSLTRKNRDGVMRIVHKLRERWNGRIVFAGERLTPELNHLATKLGITDRVIVVEKPSSIVLEALYNRAFALLFPSRFEGFGWPVIEAQACGCPVICSDAASLPEIAGDGAFIRAVDDDAGFAEDVLRLTDPEVRAELIARGFENLPRFDTQRMVEDYLRIYREAAGIQA